MRGSSIAIILTLIAACSKTSVKPVATSKAEANTDSKHLSDEQVIGCYSSKLTASHGSESNPSDQNYIKDTYSLRLENVDDGIPIPMPEGKGKKVTLLKSDLDLVGSWTRHNDEIRVTWSANGLSFTQLQLHATPTGFEGEVFNYWDWGQTTDHRNARLKREPCESFK